MSKPKADSNLKSGELLVCAATKLFVAQGFDGASVKQIADEAGVNVGLISYHFGGKMGLYQKCLEQFGEERLSAVKRILTKVSSKKEFELRFKMYIEESLEASLARPEVMAMVFRACELDRKEVEEVFRNTFIKGLEELIEFFRQAKRKKYIKAQVDPFITAVNLHSMIGHATRMQRAHKRYFEWDISKTQVKKQFLEQVTEMLLKGILTND